MEYINETEPVRNVAITYFIGFNSFTHIAVETGRPRLKPVLEMRANTRCEEGNFRKLTRELLFVIQEVQKRY